MMTFSLIEFIFVLKTDWHLGSLNAIVLGLAKNNTVSQFRYKNTALMW